MCHRFCDVETLNAMKQCGGTVAAVIWTPGCMLFADCFQTNCTLVFAAATVWLLDFIKTSAVTTSCVCTVQSFSVFTNLQISRHQIFLPLTDGPFSFLVHVHPPEAVFNPMFSAAISSPSAPDCLEMFEAGQVTRCLRGNYCCVEMLVRNPEDDECMRLHHFWIIL